MISQVNFGEDAGFVVSFNMFRTCLLSNFRIL